MSSQNAPPAQRARGGWLTVALLAALLLLLPTSLVVGARPIMPDALWQALIAPEGNRDAIVLWQLRLPRTVLAIVAGAALGLAGGLVQALTRNPLADPGLIGINAGASFSVVVAISALGITSFSGFVWFALAGAGLASCTVFLLSARANASEQQVRLVLAGAAISASLGACTGVITMLDSTAFDSYRFWVVGAVGGRDPDVVWQLAPLLAIGASVALFLARPLNALAMGNDIGRTLGLPVRRVFALTFLATALLSGGATAAVGPISFIGLVVPHLARLAVGANWQRILPLCLLGGPVLLLIADIVGRVVAFPGELEAGIVTAFIGSPVLLWLVRGVTRKRRV